MKIFNRLCGALSALAAAWVMSFGAFAYAGGELFEAAGYGAGEEELTRLIIGAVKERRTDDIDISGYGLSFEEFEDIYVTALTNEPSLFYVSTVQANLTYYDRSHILSFSPHYVCTEKQEAAMRKKIDKYALGVIESIEADLTDVEKALFIHERMAEDIVYRDSGDPEDGRSVYDAFVKKEAVCMGYAMGFEYFMDMLDIPCICVYNDEHIWNEVKLDGQWYYIDVTWDDSAAVTDGFVFHNMTLLSDKGMKSAVPVHREWGYSFPANSDKYAKAFWTNSNTVMCRYDGYWYYTTPDGFYRYSFGTGKSGRIFSFPEKWRAGDSRVWSVSFSRPAEYGGDIYFNSADKIYRYDPEENRLYVFYSPKMEENEQIFDIYISGERLIFTVSGDIVSGDGTKRAVRLAAKR